MTLPLLDATPEQMAALMKLNKRLYGGGANVNVDKPAPPPEQARALTPLQQKAQQNQQAVQAKLAQEKAQRDVQQAERNKIMQRAQQAQQVSRDVLASSRQALEDSRMGRPINTVPLKSYQSYQSSTTKTPSPSVGSSSPMAANPTPLKENMQMQIGRASCRERV